MRQNSSAQVFGSLGASQAQNSVVATLPITVPGRYRIWGSARHTLIDGLKLVTPIAMVLCSAANDTAVWGPIVVDVPAATNIVIQLATATGASDSASCVIYAENINH